MPYAHGHGYLTVAILPKTQPLTARSSSARLCTPETSPYLCWNFDWADLLPVLYSCCEFMCVRAMSCLEHSISQHSLSTRSYILSDSSTVFPEPWNIENTALFNYRNRYSVCSVALLLLLFLPLDLHEQRHCFLLYNLS